MIISCPNCATRLQFDKEKIPSRPFGVRCPKCQQIINAQPPAPSLQDAVTAVEGDLPISSRSQQDMSAKPAAPSFRGDEPVIRSAVEPPAESVVLRLLADLLRRETSEKRVLKSEAGRYSEFDRRALVCVSAPYSAAVARSLSDEGYDVLVATQTAQAVDRMREERVDVLVVDAEFDMFGQGAVHINREVNALRMPERRRMVYVQLSTTERTGDSHAALLAGRNLFVNVSDLSGLPRLLDKNIRDFNELYRDFNKALGLAEI